MFRHGVVTGVFRIAVMLIVFAIAGFLACNIVFTDEPPRSVTVATWNLEWFFDENQVDNRTDLSREQSAPRREDWEWKKKKVAEVIAEIRPTILCLQEVENRDSMYRLRKHLKEQHGLSYRFAFIAGFDFGTEQDVAIMYRSGLVEFSRREQTSEMFASGEYYNLSKHLFARFEWGSGDDRESLLIFNGHLRARAEHANLRQRQGRLIRHWLSDAIAAGENVIATGDFNTEEDYGFETAGSEISIIRGLATESTTDDLLDAHAHIPETVRQTHISGRQYDRVLFSPALSRNDPGRKDLVFEAATVRRDLVVQGEIDRNHWDGYYSIPPQERDISDHYPLIVKFVFK